MKMKKQWKIAVCMFLFALLLVGTIKITASAGEIAQENVSIDYIYETITVSTDVDEVIYYTNTYYADLSRWDACEVRDGKAVFDISWVNEEKTVRLYLCGDKQTKVVSINLTWQENFGVKFMGTLRSADITEVEEWKDAYADYPNFSEDTGYFIFTLEENKRDNYYFDLDTIEWRKGDDGVWREFSELDLKEMNIRGIKLEFRIKADNASNTTANSGISTASVLTNEGTRASSIAKVTVAKLADAPEITVNTDIMTIEVRNGQEFSLDKENWTLIPTYSKKQGTKDYLVNEDTREDAISPIYTNQRVTGLLIQEVLGIDANTEMTESNLATTGTFHYEEENGIKTGIIVYVREAGTEKKAASLIKEVVIPFTDSTISKAEKADLEIYQGESKTGNGGIICHNVSTRTYPNGDGVKYQVAILTPEEYAEYEAAGKLENIDVSKLKWTSVKSGRMIKLANKKVPEGSYLLYRIAGEYGNLPSTYLISDEIRYDQITYAGFASSKKTVGDTLEAVVSTNVEADSVTYKWQRCQDIEAEVQVWTDIDITDEAGALINTSTYTLTEADIDHYIRVVISNTSSEKASEPIGPVKAAN